MRELGLVFGCIDLIVTPEGEHVFLLKGQFLWVEHGAPGPRCCVPSTLLVERRLDPHSTRLWAATASPSVTSWHQEQWEHPCAEDDARHAPFDALRLVEEESNALRPARAVGPRNSHGRRPR